MTPTVRSVIVSTAVIGVLTFIGAARSRWMSDDGLIVLRTIRNLQAGNGPVFNVGERVETNTSTVWQYLIFFVAQLGIKDLAAISLWLGVILGTVALVVGSIASYRFHVLRGGRTAGLGQAKLPGGASSLIFVPFGGLLYISLAPAREFFTSGLEWSLCLFYLAVLWFLLVEWDHSTIDSVPGDEAQRILAPLKQERKVPGRVGYTLAFWSGLSWLVRPELALYGALTGLTLVVCHRSVKERLQIIAIGIALPMIYQIFRMGYYGLLTPHTAVAKSADDSMWTLGFKYFHDFMAPHHLWIPLLLVAAYYAIINVKGFGVELPVAVLLIGALIHTVYLVRIGGDFMHGRMLLLPLFAVLLPVMLCGVASVLSAFLAGAVFSYGAMVAYAGMDAYQTWRDKNEIDNLVIYEKGLWTHFTGRENEEPPRNESDFRALPHANGFDQAMSELESGSAFAFFAVVGEEEKWVTIARGDDELPPTIYWTSLGFTGAFAPLDVRVLDPIGLANPLAARMPREEGARIGHDKNLAGEWQVADSSADLGAYPENLINVDQVLRCRQALQTPELKELLDSYREPMSFKRFFKNIGFALTDGRTLQLDPDPGKYGV
ncbi:hypothetical protein KIP68_09785 [Corynebacterium aquatimens]